MKSTIDIGAAGEKACTSYLRRNRYKIIEKNYRTLFGEIDIIAKNRECICFVEVKTRKSDYLVSASAAVDRNKRIRIIRSAYVYLSRNPTELMSRFDVAEIYYGEDGELKINYIENAFDANGNL